MDFYKVDLHGYEAQLPIIPLPSGIRIAFFNLHGNVEMTEHCGKELAKMVADCDVLLTAESKGLQLTHVIARELGHKFYAVARKSKKLYMQDGLEVTIKSSITTGKEQKLYISKFDADLMRGKKWASSTTLFPPATALKVWKNWLPWQAESSAKKHSFLPKATPQNATTSYIWTQFRFAKPASERYAKQADFSVGCFDLYVFAKYPDCKGEF